MSATPHSSAPRGRAGRRRASSTPTGTSWSPTPSEHVRSGRIFFHTELGERGLAHAVAEIGDEVFFCASDFPHEPKEEFLDAVAGFSARGDIGAQNKRRVLWDNALRLYGPATGLVSP